MTKRKLTIPVSSETYDLLQQLAYENGQSLAAFCRDRIMAKERLNEEFKALQSTLVAVISETGKPGMDNAKHNNSGADNPAIITEVLLLLRSLVSPQKMLTVHSELRRIGMEPFIRK